MQPEPAQGPRPFVVTVVPASPAPERDLGDVLLGALGVTGALLVVALAFGALLGALRLGWVRRHPPDDDHMPPVRPTGV